MTQPRLVVKVRDERVVEGMLSLLGKVWAGELPDVSLRVAVLTVCGYAS